MIKYFKNLKWCKLIKNSGLFDVKYYIFMYPDVRKKGLDPIKHYVKFGADEGRNPSAYFDTKYYINTYEDVRESGINPLAHYILYGKKEGRQVMLERVIQEIKNRGIKGIASRIKEEVVFQEKKGQKSYDSHKETIIFVSHESSATGAPLLGLNIIKSLLNDYNVISMIMKKSNIHHEFLANAFLVVEGNGAEVFLKKIFAKLSNKYSISMVLCNSVVTFPALKIAHTLKLPTLSLVHEFAEYTKPNDRMLQTLMFANKVIVPAQIIKDSILENIRENFGQECNPNNIEITPQGKLFYLPESHGKSDTVDSLYAKLNIRQEKRSKTKIVVASGYVQIRKGVDLFIYTARYIKKYYQGECKFVWVGDGFNPHNDFAYSLWLQRELKHLGLEKDFIFLEHQSSLDNIFSIADIFCLTSRMDPFPNVVIDAMEKDLPIACFRDASGSVEFLETSKAEALVADYLDCNDMALKIAKYLQVSHVKNGKNRRIVGDTLNFDNYMKKIKVYINMVQEDQTRVNEIVDIIDKDGNFDSAFYDKTVSSDESLYNYVNIAKKKLYNSAYHFYPKTAFNDLIWEETHTKTKVPLLEAIETKRFSTHQCKVDITSTSEVSFKYAVHLHLYYSELTSEFAKYFRNLSGDYDLFISVVSGAKIETIKKVFDNNTKAKNIIIKVIENIGRDIGPMLFDFRDEIIKGNYKIVGHFHSKKSVSTDKGMGNRWRSYLLDNLVGTSMLSKGVLNLFEDEKIGLVFAEDRHCVGIGKNKVYIDKLTKMMKMQEINQTPIFPLGNMFWARVDAIKELFELDAEKILQEEPLPYDGSFMHAIERITPLLVESKGYLFSTVYKRGTIW